MRPAGSPWKTAVAISLIVAGSGFMAAATGQTAPAADPAQLVVLEDAASDNTYAPAGVDTMPTRWSATDLRSLTVSENGTSYVFALAVGSLGTETAPVVDDVNYRMLFHGAGKLFGVRAYYDAQTGNVDAYLGQEDPEFGYMSYDEQVPAKADPATSVILYSVPFKLLVDADGTQLSRGDMISDFAVDAIATGGSFVTGYTVGTVETSDRMPDSGLGKVPWAVANGAGEQGTVRIGSEFPMRVSNGEATTIIYEVSVRNLADRGDVLRMSASDVPSNWVVTFPQEEVRLPADDEALVPVLVTIPFSHDHGHTASFNVTAASRSDPLSLGTVELGVRYTKVPQPAGHHDTVYLHPGDGFPFINTLETNEIPPEEASSGRFSASCGFSDGTDSGSSELVPLIPGFELGLDFDLGRTGLARIAMHTDAPLIGSQTLGGFFVALPAGQRPSPCPSQFMDYAVAAIERSQPIEMAANSDQVIELPITPLAYGDYIPQSDQVSFVLFLILYDDQGALPICCPVDAPAPTFLEGTSFQLPLNEYHDPVDEYFAALSGIDLYTDNAQQRLVNPGHTAVFEVLAENLAADGATFDLQLTGSNLEWATILGDDRVSLDGGGSQTLGVSVTAPASAQDGDVADITLHAVDREDPNVRSIIRLLVEVDVDETHVDESEAASALADDLAGSKDTPGPALFGLLAALGLAFAWRRRR